MISIRNRQYDLKEDPELAFTRLDWAVEEIDSFALQLLTSMTISTNKPWIGILDRDILRFKLMEPKRLITSNPWQIIVNGKIHQIEGGSRLELKITLGFYTLLFYLMIYLGTLMLTFELAAYGSLDDIIGWILWIAVFPVFGTFLLNRKLNKIEKKYKPSFQ